MQHDERYRKQILVPEFGPAGQAALSGSSIAIVGCGALGSAQAMLLARAGAGHLILIDRDIVEESNLHRQILYTEADATACRPKAAAAAGHLAAVNSRIRITAHAADLDPARADELLGQSDIIIDASDNYETRFLINDWAVAHNRPWIYGGVLATGGMTATIIPGETACLACIQSEAPPAGTSPTCDTAGILPPVVHAIAAIQAMEAIKLAAGRHESVLRGLKILDLWQGTSSRIPVSRAQDCPCCVQHRYRWLEAVSGSRAIRICGQNSVHISPAKGSPPPDLEALASRLAASAGRVDCDQWSLHFVREETDLVVFRDGRILVRGVRETADARTIAAKWLGL